MTIKNDIFAVGIMIHYLLTLDITMLISFDDQIKQMKNL